jgi:hypothetical protein
MFLNPTLLMLSNQGIIIMIINYATGGMQSQVMIIMTMSLLGLHTNQKIKNRVKNIT